MIRDIDSPDTPTHGNRENSVYNGHFGYTLHRPDVWSRIVKKWRGNATELFDPGEIGLHD